MRRIVSRVTALVVALALGGCVTTGTGSESARSPAEARMRQQAEVFNTTVAEGAAVGCAVGAIIGILASNNRNRGSGAAIGCGAGALVGGGTGYMVASTQEKYANEEAHLDAMISDLKTDNQRLAGLISSSRAVIAEDKAAIEALDAKIAAGKVSARQAKTQIAEVDGNIAYLQKTVENLKKRESEYQTARDNAASQVPAGKTAEMDAQISSLKTQIATLERDLDGLVSRRKVSRVG